MNNSLLHHLGDLFTLLNHIKQLSKFDFWVPIWSFYYNSFKEFKSNNNNEEIDYVFLSSHFTTNQHIKENQNSNGFFGKNILLVTIPYKSVLSYANLQEGESIHINHVYLLFNHCSNNLYEANKFCNSI
ncbi:hypothetical protein ACTFIW_000944 [Dictyostelium discoideum]